MQSSASGSRVRVPWRRLAFVLPLVAVIVVVISQVDFRPDLSHLEHGLLTGDPEGNYAAIGNRLAATAAEIQISVAS